MKILPPKIEAEQRKRVVRRALALQRAAAEFAARFFVAAYTSGSQRAINCAIALWACSLVENYWAGLNLHNAEGQRFNGCGTYYACNKPFCPSCAVKKARRNARRLLEVVSAFHLHKTERWQMVTLTGPTVPGISLHSVMRIYLRAFELLRKREAWRTYVRAAARSFDFTVNKAGDYHGHIHALIAGRRMDRDALTIAWSTCLWEAAKEYGLNLTTAPLHGRVVVDVRLVLSHEPPAQGHETISSKNAVRRVSTYVCKPYRWERVRTEDLLELAELKRLPSLFTTLGDFRKKPSPLLDNRNVNDGRKRKRGYSTFSLKPLREKVRLTRELRKVQLESRYPDGQLIPLADYECSGRLDLTTYYLWAKRRPTFQQAQGGNQCRDWTPIWALRRCA